MKRALLVIDVQNEYFSGMLPVTYPQNSFNNIKAAMDLAASYNIPIAIIQHTAPQKDSATFRKESYEWEIHQEAINRKHDIIIEKNLPGSFTNTKLEAWLRSNSIECVVISGYMTQMCCDTTARQALHRNYQVEFLSDATGTLQISNYAGTVSAEQLHNAILITQAMRFSKVLTTEHWASELKNNN